MMRGRVGGLSPGARVPVPADAARKNYGRCLIKSDSLISAEQQNVRNRAMSFLFWEEQHHLVGATWGWNVLGADQVVVQVNLPDDGL